MQIKKFHFFKLEVKITLKTVVYILCKIIYLNWHCKN